MRQVFLFLLFLPQPLIAQYQFGLNNDIPVQVNSNDLDLAWTGGLNSAQFQKLDLDQDGIEDLVIYNRISEELVTFLTIDDQYVFSPDYTVLFPEDVQDWLILKDFDCDGKKDLFTSTALGIKVYRNTTTASNLTWELTEDFLRFNNNINLQVNASDIPGIEDIDGDGDLDILAYRFSSSSTIDYFKNTSIEDTGNCGELTFVREVRVWGGFEECNCNDIVFGQPCTSGGIVNSGERGSVVEEIEHAGGKTILPLDIDNDGDIDLITSDEFCETLYFLENEGDSQNAVMTSFSSFPGDEPAGFFIFPSAFFDDFDFDGIKDLVISSNSDQNLLNGIDFTANNSIYKNVGSNANIDLDTSSPFMQNAMIDLGETTYPVLIDFDADGDLDLFVGNRGLPVGSDFIGTIYHFENVGTRFEPSFQMINADFMDLSNSGYHSIKPQFVDLDNDGDLDLTYQGTNSINETNLYYRLNSTGRSDSFDFGAEQTLDFETTESSHPYLFDINRDGNVDILEGGSLGGLSFYRNFGNLDFQENIPEYAGIGTDFDKRNVIPFIADLDNNAQNELILSNSSGQLEVLSGLIGLSFTLDSTSVDLLANSTLSSITPSRFGAISPMAFGDLTGNGKPDLILGNNRGGLYFLENSSQRLLIGQTASVDLELFPNPARNSFFLRTDVNTTVEIYSAIGQQVNGTIGPVVADTTVEIDLTGLAPGIYLIRALSNFRHPTVKRLIVER